MSGATPDGTRLPDSTVGRLAVGYLGGVCAARLFGLVGPADVGPFALVLSVVAMPVLWWTGTKLAVRPRAPDRRRTRLALAVAAGVVADELVYLALRQAGVGYWDPRSLAGSVVLAAAVTAVVVGFAAAGDGQGVAPTPGRWLSLASGAAVALSFVGYRASQLYLRARGVPNEERSMVLAGYEIHHVSTGSVLLVLGAVALASPGPGRRWHRVAAVAVAVGCGFVADEYPYVFYPEMTDALYFGAVSTAGGAVATVTVIGMVAYHTHNRQERDSDGY